LSGPSFFSSEIFQRRTFSETPERPQGGIESDEKINAVLEHVRQRMKSGMELAVIVKVIKMLADAGKWQKLMVLVADMVAHGLEPNDEIYRSMITACGYLAQWNEALQFFRDMMSLDLDPSADNYAIAIIACSKLGRFDKSMELFEGWRTSGSPPDLVVYHAMLTAFLAAKEPILAKAFSLLDQCRVVGLQPSPAMYWQIIQVASQGGNNVEVVALYKDLRMHAPGMRLPNDAVYVAVMHALHAVGDQDTLLQDLFLEMSYLRVSPPPTPVVPTGVHGSLFELTFPVEVSSNLPTTLTFNIAISSSIANRNYNRALDLGTKIIRMDRIQADEVTYNLTIDASRRVGNVKRCFEIKDTMSQLGIVPTMETYTMLLDQSGEFWCEYSPDRLRQLVEEFRALWGTQLDARGHAVIVEAFAANLMVEDMMKAFNDMPKGSRTLPLFTLVMAAYSKLVPEDPAQIDMVLSLLARAENEGHEPAGYTLSTIMHGCALARRWDDFQALKERLYAMDGYLSDKAFSAVLTQCKQTQSWELMVESFEKMLNHDVVLAFAQYDTILMAYRKLGRRKEGFALFESLLERFDRRDIPISTITTAISFSMDTGDVDQAMRLLRLMEHPDAFAYQGVIGMYIRKKQPVRAAELIFEMVEKALQPNERTFNFTLAELALAKKKEHSTTLRLIKVLPERRMLPPTWFNLMVATEVVPNQEITRYLVDEALRMDIKDLSERQRVISRATQVACTYNLTFKMTQLLKRADELKISISVKVKNQIFSQLLKRREWKLATEIRNATNPATGAQLADLLKMSIDAGFMSYVLELTRELVKLKHNELSPELISVLFGKIVFPSGLPFATKLRTLLTDADIAVAPAVYMSLINRLTVPEISEECLDLADEICNELEIGAGVAPPSDLLNFLVRTYYKCRQWEKGNVLFDRLLRDRLPLEMRTCEVIMNVRSLVLKREEGMPLQWKAYAALLRGISDDRAAFRALWAEATLNLDGNGEPLSLQMHEGRPKILPPLDERNDTVDSAVDKMLSAFEGFYTEGEPGARDKAALDLRCMGSTFDRLLLAETNAESGDYILPTAEQTEPNTVTNAPESKSADQPAPAPPTTTRDSQSAIVDKDNQTPIVSRAVVEAKTLAEKIALLGSKQAGINLVTFNLVLKACVREGEPERAPAVMEELVKCGFEPDILSYRYLIGAYRKLGDWEAQLDVLRAVHSRGLKSHVEMFNNSVAACAQRDAWQNGLTLLGMMAEHGVKPNSVTFNTLIVLCCRQGQWRTALQLLDEMQSKKLRPNATIFNAVLQAVADVGKWAEMHSLLRNMHSCKISKSPQAYMVLFSWYKATRNLEEASSLAAEMDKKKVPWSIPLYVAYLEVFAAGGHYEQAEAVVATMHKCNMVPDEATWVALITAHGNARHVVEALDVLDQATDAFVIAHTPITTALYNAAIKACARSGRWSEALELIQKVRACLRACGIACVRMCVFGWVCLNELRVCVHGYALNALLLFR
jgi:pentatricopeptide repeat protein